MAVSGVVARLAYAGLNQSNLEPSERTRRTLLAFAVCRSRLRDVRARHVGTAHHRLAMVCSRHRCDLRRHGRDVVFGPRASLHRRARRRSSRLDLREDRPTPSLSHSTPGPRDGWRGIFVLGSRHFANGWPGTGGHPWAHQGLVPGGVAAFAWAATLFVTAYWAHPASLLSFPGPELAWMVVSPIALMCFGIGAVRLVREIELSPRLLRFEARLAQLGGMVMVMFLIGASLWVVDGGPGPRNLFHVGAIDIGSVCVMLAALATAGRALQLIGRLPWFCGDPITPQMGSMEERDHRVPDRRTKFTG